MNRKEKGDFNLILECPEQIPCNPCVDACPFGAISLDGKGIASIPLVDKALCKECLQCLTVCPGQAIYALVNYGEYSIITFPFEFLPSPKVGDFVTAANRTGKGVCEAEVVGFRNIKKYNSTALLSIKVPKHLAGEVRFIKLENGDADE